MNKNRRDFLKAAGTAGAGIMGYPFLKDLNLNNKSETGSFLSSDEFNLSESDEKGLSIIGAYGPWAAGMIDKELPVLSFRRKEWKSIARWKKTAITRYKERLSSPDTGNLPEVRIINEYTYDGLHIEELQWQLPYGPPTDAVLLKPAGATGRLPGILAFHDHAGNKFFGAQKIVRTSVRQHPMMTEHQKTLYEGRAWANEAAKRGYVVLVPDAFPFASRRVLLKDVPESQRQGLTDPDPGNLEGITAYNKWAGQHETIMAKSLFSSGTTWPGIFLAEDIKALDILCSRPDVDAGRTGCCGLSGGGMRSVFLGGADDRVRCAIPAGFMTTWRDLVLNKAVSHTWMTYVPLLPKELDFPEILGLRVPLPVLVLNNSEDGLFTNNEMHRADEILKEVFDKAGAGEKYKCSFHPGPHKFDIAMQEEAFDWFDRWLKG